MKKRKGIRMRSGPPLIEKEVFNLLLLSAPAIEAAGSLDRAIRVGAIQCDPHTAKQLRKTLPKSMGGKVDYPGVDDDWRKLVADMVKERNVDMVRMRMMFGPPSNN